MKTYAELFQEIQTFPYSDEMFNLYKECVQLEFTEIYIDNQLYIKENFDNTNKILMESLDEDRLNKVIMEAAENSESWFIKFKNMIVKFFKNIIKWLTGFFNNLTSKKNQERINEAEKLLKGEESDQSSSNENNESTPEKQPDGQESFNNSTDTNIGNDSNLFQEDSKASLTKEVAIAVGNRLYRFLFGIEKNSRQTLEALNSKNPIILVSFGTIGKRQYNLQRFFTELQHSLSTHGFSQNLSNTIINVLNFNNISYVFETKQYGIEVISLDEFKSIFDDLNSNKGKGTTNITNGLWDIFSSNNLNDKLLKAINKYEHENSFYTLNISNIKIFEAIIKNLHKVLINMEKSNDKNKYNYREIEDPTKLKNKLLLRSGKAREEISYKLGGYETQGIRHTRNTDEHFNRTTDSYNFRKKEFQFYSKFSKASANLLRSMQVAQKFRDVILSSVPAMNSNVNKEVKNTLTKDN